MTSPSPDPADQEWKAPKNDRDDCTIKETPVRVTYARLYCPCGGEIRSTGHGVTTMSTSWQHQCVKCGEKRWLQEKSFPKLMYHEDAENNAAELAP